MKLKFADKTLKDAFLHFETAKSQFGDEVARKYIKSVNFVQIAESVSDLFKVPVINCCVRSEPPDIFWKLGLTQDTELGLELEEDEALILHLTKNKG